MKKMTATILVFICAAIFYGCYFLGLPYVLNRPFTEQFIENKIFQTAGYKIDIVNLKFKSGFFPSVKIYADDFFILNSDNSKALAINKPYAKVKIFPLLFKKAEIVAFNAKNFEAKLVFDSNSQFKLGSYLIEKNKNSKININSAKLNIEKYNVSLFDENQNKKIVLDGKYFFLNEFRKNKHIEFATDASLCSDRQNAKLQANFDIRLPLNNISEDKLLLNLNIEHLDLSDFTVYAKSLSNGKIKELRGIINVNTATRTVQGHKDIIGDISISNFGIMQDDLAASIYGNYPLNVNMELNIIKNGVKINNLKVLSHNIDVFLNGTIIKTGKKFPELDLKAAINKLSGEELLTLFPGEENLNPDFNFYKLKKYVIYGNATGNINIKGDADYPNLYGSALLTDVYLQEPIKDAPKNGIVKINLNGHYMNLSAHVLTSPTDYVDVNGTFKLFRDRYTDMYIKTTGNIDLVKAKKVIMPLHEIFKFELGPIPMMNIDAGAGTADLHITGSKLEPHSWGNISFKNGIASFITINNMTGKNITGSAVFDDTNVTFKTSSAYLNNLPLNIDGKCNLNGDLSVNVEGNGQNSKDLLKIINTSPVLWELREMLEPITFANGKTKVLLNIFGHVDRGKEPIFNKDLFAKGQVELINNTMKFFSYNIPASGVSGLIHFDKDDGDFNLKANFVNSPISTNGVIHKKTVTANAQSNKFAAADGLKIAQLIFGNKIPQISGLESITTSFSGRYHGPMDLNKIDYGKITAKGKIYNNLASQSSVIVNNSDFEIKNSNVKTSLIKGAFKKNPYTLQLDIANAFSDKRLVNGNFSMKDFDISTLNDLDIPQLKDFEKFEGTINIASKIKNNNVKIFTQPGGASVVYKPKPLKIEFSNGNILFDKDTLNLNKINAHIGVMPIFLNGKISNILKKPDLSLYINAKPSQEFFDQFFNLNSVYPIKLKGDLMLSSNLHGLLDCLHTKTELKLDESSSLYYMGATVGDLINPVKIYIETITMPSSVKLKNFVYDKIITSQNNKTFANTQVRAKGDIELLSDNNLKFRNFSVKTDNPTDAKIFNIIFKKPFMKQGVFTSDLIINGEMMTPKILGKLDVTSIDIPVFDTTVKDVSFDFRQDNVYIKTKSFILNNPIDLDADMQNKLDTPYTFNNIKVHFEDLDMNKISEAIQNHETDLYKRQLNLAGNAKTVFQPQIIVQHGEITADNIKIRELKATDFKADFSVDENMILYVNAYNSKLADGSVDGDMTYNLLTNELNLNSHIHDSNAQTISESLFNMKGQFYGTLNGGVQTSCTGKNQEECIKTLSGSGNFIITNGRMPKLGSLEYLLKAGNLVTSGITGISINGIIDLITPLKTGEFKSITGNFDIENGIVRDTEVFSKGKDLNMYLTGSYNIENYIANMEVYGSLSSNITSVFGKIKNLSLNTLLNTIPLLNRNEISEDIAAKINKIPNNEHSSIARIFAVDINGDINGINYVKSFKWVK